MPSADAMTRSSGVVMNPRTSSAFAPMYVVVTVIAAFSLRGYWRTFSERIACTPAITIRRLTTSARTGRRMNRSVNFMDPSAIDRLGRDLGVRRQIVPQHHGRAVAQLERAAARDGLACGQPGHDRDQRSLVLAEADELLVRDEDGVARRVLLLLDREHRVAV